MAHGKIKSKAPQLGTMSQRLAARVAAVNFPTTATSVFDKLRERQLQGGVNDDPRKQFQTSSLGALMPTPTGTQSLLTSQVNARTINGEEDVGTQSIGSNKGNTKYVDDKNFPVTLASILGSKMLSPEQLRAASIQNVSQMFQVHGAQNEEEKQEVYFMFQRMMLEGFIRGVDITKDLPRQGGTSVVITNGAVPNASNGNVIGMATQGTVYLKGAYWRSKDDAQKLALFYHEMGHELMNKNHTASGMEKSGGGLTSAKAIHGTKEAYNNLMNGFFTNENSRGFEHLRVAVKGGQEAQYDPSWFPAATGVDSGYSPGATGNGPMTTNNTTNVTNNTYVPPTINMGNGMAPMSLGQNRMPMANARANMVNPGDSDVEESGDSFSQELQGMANTGVQPNALQGVAGNITRGGFR